MPATIVVGVFAGILFVRREIGEPRRIMPFDLLARPVVALSAVGALMAFVASMNLILSLPFRLEQGFGFRPAEVGAVIAPWPLMMMFVSPLAGILSDRVPAGLLGGVGMTIATIALLLLAWLLDDAGYVGMAWRMSLCGVGFGLFLSPNARLIIGSAPRERAASAGGLISTVRLTGQTAGATLAAGLLALGASTGGAPALASAALTIVAGLCSIARMTPTLRNPAQEEVSELQPATQLK